MHISSCSTPPLVGRGNTGREGREPHLLRKHQFRERSSHPPTPITLVLALSTEGQGLLVGSFFPLSFSDGVIEEPGNKPQLDSPTGEQSLVNQLMSLLGASAPDVMHSPSLDPVLDSAVSKTTLPWVSVSMSAEDKSRGYKPVACRQIWPYNLFFLASIVLNIF